MIYFHIPIITVNPRINGNLVTSPGHLFQTLLISYRSTQHGSQSNIHPISLPLQIMLGSPPRCINLGASEEVFSVKIPSAQEQMRSWGVQDQFRILGIPWWGSRFLKGFLDHFRGHVSRFSPAWWCDWQVGSLNMYNNFEMYLYIYFLECSVCIVK